MLKKFSSLFFAIPLAEFSERQLRISPYNPVRERTQPAAVAAKRQFI